MSSSPKLWRSKLRRLRRLSAWVNTRDQQVISTIPPKRSHKELEAATSDEEDDASSKLPPIKKVCTDSRETFDSVADTTNTATIEASASSTEPLPSQCESGPVVQRTQLVEAIALHAKSRRVECSGRTASSVPSAPKECTPPRPRVDLNEEIERVLAAQSSEEVFGIESSELGDEETVARAWKRLMLLLHPDKLQGLEERSREAGAEALNRVHEAKEELKRRQQEICAELPAAPVAASDPRLAEGRQGERKYEISWILPQSQDPRCPVEKYEIWGPRYFSEAGDPFDWVLLATLPPLQSHFVLVEEAPTQQDVMWAADRVLRPTLPIAVHAANGKGSSEALTFEMPWATTFPWLGGTRSMLCPGCVQIVPQRGGPWNKCSGCGFGIPAESSIVIRCPECQGEVLWNNGVLNCSCCLKRFAEARPQRGHSFPKRPAPQHVDQQRGGQKQWCRSGPNTNSARSWGRPR